jgi:putative flippase GtrA
MKAGPLADRYAVSFFAYLIVGTTCAAVEWSVFCLLLSRVDVRIASMIAFIVATFVNLAASRAFVFKSSRTLFRESLLLFGASALAFSLNYSVFIILYKSGAPAIIAKILGTGAAFLANYGLRQWVIFSRISRFRELSSYAPLLTSIINDDGPEPRGEP